METGSEDIISRAMFVLLPKQTHFWGKGEHGHLNMDTFAVLYVVFKNIGLTKTWLCLIYKYVLPASTKKCLNG